MMALDDVAAYQDELQSALLDGYRTEQPLPEAYELQRRCYRLDVMTLSLTGLDANERQPRHLPADRVDEAAEGMRKQIQGLLTAA